ncbi:MAG: VOC family protein [Acidobacteria bacterium]|nr:VOC family protein [Acidobacteriota bacterium]
MPRVIRYEIAADDPDMMAQFYGGLFGWEFQKVGDQDYWVINSGEGPGIDGAMIRRIEGGPGVINTLDVPSVDDFCQGVAEMGGQVLLAKTAIPGVGFFAYCQDPEGNTFGVMELNAG